MCSGGILTAAARPTRTMHPWPVTPGSGKSGDLRALQNVVWIGGGSEVGSTVARRLATECGRTLCACDDQQAAHTRRTTPSDAPLLHAFIEMDMDSGGSPDPLPMRAGRRCTAEGFELIVEDLGELGRARSPGSSRAQAARNSWPRCSVDRQRPSGSCRHPSSVAKRSTIAGRRGASPGGRATRSGRWRTCSHATRCTPRRCTGRRAALGLPTIVVDGTLSVTDLVALVARSLELTTRPSDT